MTEMLEAGVHFGHRKSRWHPKMKDYIFGAKNNIHVIDLNKSVLKFAEALSFIKKISSEGKKILFVGTKPQAGPIIEQFSKETKVPYVINRWLGGTLTNFKTIKTRIRKLKELEDKKASGEFDVYTKKEKIDIDRTIVKMNATLGGIRDLNDIPYAVFITDLNMDRIAITEAKKVGIKTIGIADTNTDPNVLDYLIPGNDDSVQSLSYIYSKIAAAIIEGKSEQKK